MMNWGHISSEIRHSLHDKKSHSESGAKDRSSPPNNSLQKSQGHNSPIKQYLKKLIDKLIS
jgi:hypothetical protein